MHVHAIINGRAGSVVGSDAAAVAETVKKAWQDAGHDIACEVVEPDELPRRVRALAEGRADCIIIGGGDGSVRTAATALCDTGKVLGVLPLGTVNRLARDLGIPLDAGKAAAALAAGRTREIDVAEVNGNKFLCNAILGLTTRFSSERQRLRGKPMLDRARGYMAAVRHLLNARRRMSVTLDDGDAGSRRVRVLSLVVSCNAYGDGASLLMHRPALDEGQLALYAARHASGWELVRGVVRAMLGRLDADPDVVHLRGPTLAIDVVGRRSTVLSVDGELEEVETPLRFSIRPRALKVLAPAAPASPEA